MKPWERYGAAPKPWELFASPEPPSFANEQGKVASTESSLAAGTDIPSNPDERIVGHIYKDRQGNPRRWGDGAWLTADESRETTLGEMAKGYALKVPQGLMGAVRAVVDTGNLALNALGTGMTPEGERAFRDSYQEANDYYEQQKPAAFRAEQNAGIVERDGAGNIVGLRAPSAESVGGALIDSAAQLPAFIAGGAGLTKLAEAGLKNSPRLAAALGYGGTNAALIAPSQRQDTIADAERLGMSPEAAREAGNNAGLMTAGLTALTGGAGGLMSKLTGASANSLPSALARGFAAEAPFEGVEEAGQSAIGDVALGREVNAANALDAGLLAGLTGGLPGSAIAGMEYAGRPVAPPQVTPTVTPSEVVAGPLKPAAQRGEAMADAILGEAKSRRLMADPILDAAALERAGISPIVPPVEQPDVFTPELYAALGIPPEPTRDLASLLPESAVPSAPPPVQLDSRPAPVAAPQNLPAPLDTQAASTAQPAEPAAQPFLPERTSGQANPLEAGRLDVPVQPVAAAAPAPVSGDVVGASPQALTRPGDSWVLRNKETGEVVAETRDRKKVEALNTDKYEAVPAGQHLAQFNEAVKAAGGVQPAPGWNKSVAPMRGQLSVRMGGNEYPVASYEDASAKFRELRGSVDIGGMPVVELIDQGGNPVGYIGQAGEVYEGNFQRDRLSPERKAPVYRPPRGEALPTPATIEGEAVRVAEDGYAPPPRKQFSALDMRQLVGWSQRGGLMVRGPVDQSHLNDEQRNGLVDAPKGPVIGRTRWTGWDGPDGQESTFWKNRPKGITEGQANVAFDKFERGEPLNAKQQRLIDYAQAVAADYDDALNLLDDEARGYAAEAERLDIEALREQLDADIAEADASEAMSLADLYRELAYAGVDLGTMTPADTESNGAYAARLWNRLSEARNGTDQRTEASDSAQGAEANRGRNPAAAVEQVRGTQADPAARQEVAPSAGLFGAPSTRDILDNAQRTKDAARDGKTGTGRTDMLAGDGELFAGPRPEQADVEAPKPATKTDADRYNEKLAEWDSKLARFGRERVIEQARSATAGNFTGRDFNESAESFYGRNPTARATRDWVAKQDGREALGPPAASFTDTYDARVKASREAGNKHLDREFPETLKGKAIRYVHDPKVSGVVRSVDRNGNLHVNWSDAYSAEKEMAVEVKEGRKQVMRSTLGPTDLKDYVLADAETKFSMPAAEREANFRRWSSNAPLVSRDDAMGYAFKTGQKVVVEAIHGTKRPDRIGKGFNAKRATSGPMPYFTSDAVTGSSYAQGKNDTSLSYEDQDFGTWFKVKVPGYRNLMALDRAWYSLPSDVRARIAELAPRVRTDYETGENIELGPERHTNGIGNYDWEIKQARGNALKALIEGWLSSGALYNDEQRFMDVLKLAGMPLDNVTFDSPFAEYPSLFPVYVRMRKPLVTNDIPQEVVSALNAAAKRDRSRAAQGGADAWDKNTRTLRQWVSDFNENGGSDAYVWTSIPDKVTDVFRSLGYDGIVDMGGKGGGANHRVYIPFSEGQVKGKFNKGKFDDTKRDLLASIGEGGASIASPEALLAELEASPVGRSLVALEKAGALRIIHDPKQPWAGKWDRRKATLNAAQIPAGKGIGVALHELGVHAERDSLSGILGDAGFKALLATIDRWEKGSDPVAKALAIKARGRIPERTDPKDYDEERLAYAVELAANAGMESGGEIRAFLRRFAAYVKAWLSASKLGSALRARGLNFDLTPQDVAQLAAYAVARQASARAGRMAEAFSRPVAGFAEQVRERLASGERRGPMLDMGRTPAVLRMLGFPELPLRMPAGVLFKLATGKDGDRAPLTEGQIARLPELLDEPVAIFRDSEDRGLVALTSQVDAAGNPVVVALRPNALDRRIEVNLVVSAFGKDSGARWISEQVQAGRTIYRGEKDNPRVPQSVLPDKQEEAAREGMGGTLLREADLRNYRAEQRAKRLDGRFSIAPQSETGVEFTNGQEALESRLAQWVASLRVGGSRPRAVAANAEGIGAVRRNAAGAAEQGDASRAEIREQSARLIERAKAEGFHWPDDSPIVAALNALPADRKGGGAEHVAFIVGEGAGRFVIRATDNGFFGHRSDISPAQYLARLDDYSETFPSMQTRLIGVSESAEIEGHAVIWTAQPYVRGKKFKTQALLSEAMARHGWDEDGYPGVPRFKHRDTGAIIEDAHTDNVFQDDNGDLYPFDVVVEALPSERFSMPDAPAFDPATATAESVIRDGRLLSLIDALKAAGADLTAIKQAVTDKSMSALTQAIDEAIPKLRPLRVTGIKNAVTDAERAAAGRDPILRDAIKSNEETLVAAMRELRDDPNAGEEVVARLSRGGDVSLADEGILLVYKTDLLNKRAAAADTLADADASESRKDVARQAWADAEAKIAAVDVAASAIGSEAGRMLQFRQRMLREDFTFAALERKERARLERPLTQTESATIKAMADTIAEMQAKVDALQARIANAESEGAYEELVKRMARPSKQRPTLTSLRSKADAARARLAATQGVQSRRRQSGAVISPTAFYDLAVIGAYHVANGAAKFSDWVVAMRADIGAAFDTFKADHPNIFKASQTELEKPLKADASVAEVMEKIDLANITSKDVRKLIEALVGEGMRGEQAVIAAAAEKLELEESDVRSLFVQTSPKAQPTLTEAQAELRDLRKLVRLQAEIDRITAGQPKPARGPAPPDSPAVAEKKRQLAELRTSLKPVRDPEGRYQEMRGKQIAKRIKEIEDRIKAGDFAARPRVPRKLNEANQRAQYELDKVKEAFLRHQFIEMLKARSKWGKALGFVGDSLNLSRALMTSLDLSGLLRQGGFVTFGHPVMGGKAFAQTLSALMSDRAEHAIMSEIKARPNARLYEKHKLALTGVGFDRGGLSKIEENYASRWIDKAALANEQDGSVRHRLRLLATMPVRASGRVYVSFLNRLRADAFDALAATMSKTGTPTEAEAQHIADFVNTATGRGKIPRSWDGLNTFAFAPRLVASRFSLATFTPIITAPTGRMKAQISKEYARALIGVGITMSLLAYGFGGDDENEWWESINFDPRSSDFMKLKFGETRIDPFMGLSQVIVLMSRVVTGESVTNSGEVRPLRSVRTWTDLRRQFDPSIPAHEVGEKGEMPFGARGLAEAVFSFVRSKANPATGATMNFVFGQNFIGEVTTVGGEAKNLLVPMSIPSIFEAMEDQGVPRGTALGLLSLFGMSLQVHTKDNEAQLKEFDKATDTMRDEVKERLSKLPQDQWQSALDGMHKEYEGVLAGVRLDTYKGDYTDAKGVFHEAGSPKVDKEGRPKLKYDRLSEGREDEYRANAGARPDEQAHHIIADNLVRRHKLMAHARMAGYDLNHAGNMIALPSNPTGAKVGHNTDHPKYDAEVIGLLNENMKRLNREYGSLRNAPPAEVLDAVRKIEAEMRKRIEKRDVPLKDGRLAALGRPASARA